MKKVPKTAPAVVIAQGDGWIAPGTLRTGDSYKPRLDLFRFRKQKSLDGRPCRYALRYWREYPDGREEIIWEQLLPTKSEQEAMKAFREMDARLRRDRAARRPLRPQPLLVEKAADAAPVDLRDNARSVAMNLLRAEYPQLFRALDTKRDASEVLKAYVADVWALLGQGPDMIEMEALVRDAGFTRWLSSALAKPGQWGEPWKWQLALGWIRDGLHAMNDAELAKALNDRTGLKLKPGAWRARVKRMGLKSSRKIGRPEKHIFTMNPL